MNTINTALVQESMTSLTLSELTKKRHSEVLRDIRVMAKAWEKITQRKFALTTYTDLSGRKQPLYNLAKDELLFIVSKYNDEVRAVIITRLMELEKEKESQNSLKMYYLKRENERLEDMMDRQDLYRR